MNRMLRWLPKRLVLHLQIIFPSLYEKNVDDVHRLKRRSERVIPPSLENRTTSTLSASRLEMLVSFHERCCPSSTSFSSSPP